MRFERQKRNAWVYIDMLISRYRNAEMAGLSPFGDRHVNANAEVNFAVGVFNTYNAYYAETDDTWQKGRDIWCCVSGAWNRPRRYLGPDSQIARLVPFHLGKIHAEHRCGPGPDQEGHLMSPKCAVPMRDLYAYYLDVGAFALKPVEISYEVEVVVLRSDWHFRSLDDGKVLTLRSL